jgi:two-component system cell cycle response regulator DivK
VKATRADPIVLVADDDRDTRELYRACFDTIGYRTAEAGTGSQAIAAALEMIPDVLLTDYVLPEIDGADPRTAGILILMITGYASPDLERHAATAGVDRVLLKPCLPQVIMREVSRVLARRVRPSANRVPSAILPVRPRLDAHAALRVREEFTLLPGLSLTTEQARLVFDLEHDMCERVLHALVGEGFLSRTTHGAFTRPRA